MSNVNTDCRERSPADAAIVDEAKRCLMALGNVDESTAHHSLRRAAMAPAYEDAVAGSMVAGGRPASGCRGAGKLPAQGTARHLLNFDCCTRIGTDREKMMSKKHKGGPAPVPKGNQFHSGPPESVKEDAARTATRGAGIRGGPQATAGELRHCRGTPDRATGRQEWCGSLNPALAPNIRVFSAAPLRKSGGFATGSMERWEQETRQHGTRPFSSTRARAPERAARAFRFRAAEASQFPSSRLVCRGGRDFHRRRGTGLDLAVMVSGGSDPRTQGLDRREPPWSTGWACGVVAELPGQRAFCLR